MNINGNFLSIQYYIYVYWFSYKIIQNNIENTVYSLFF